MINIKGTGLQAGTHPRCLFSVLAASVGLGSSAFTYVPVLTRNETSIECIAPRADQGSSQLAVTVTLNGQQYTNTSVVFHQYSDTYALSLSPQSGPWKGGTHVRLFGDNAQLPADGHNFSFHAPLVALEVSPSSGPTQGATVVHLSGRGLFQTPGLHCKFGELRTDATVVEVRRLPALRMPTLPNIRRTH